MTLVALVLAVVAGLSFVFWPLTIAYGASGRTEFDSATGVVTRTSAESVELVWFPTLRWLGLRAIALAAIPVAITVLPVAWDRLALPSIRGVRIASLLAIAVWYVVGGPSSVSWWALPPGLALLLAISRSERPGEAVAGSAQLDRTRGPS